jgi:four helix bundle protein
MATFKRFEDIKAWQLARELTYQVHVLCDKPSMTKRFALKDQLCRAAMSAMSNVAEGYSRSTDKDFAHFLDMARGSAMEVQSHLYIVRDLKLAEEETVKSLYTKAGETAAKITALAQYLRKTRAKASGSSTGKALAND